MPCIQLALSKYLLTTQPTMKPSQLCPAHSDCWVKAALTIVVMMQMGAEFHLSLIKAEYRTDTMYSHLTREETEGREL